MFVVDQATKGTDTWALVRSWGKGSKHAMSSIILSEKFTQTAATDAPGESSNAAWNISNMLMVCHMRTGVPGVAIY
jgi:hypothetical protein